MKDILEQQVSAVTLQQLTTAATQKQQQQSRL